MIFISSVKDIDTNQYDEVWYITNNNPNMRVGCQHHKELAPFISDYMKYRQGSLPLIELLNRYGQALWSGKYDEAIDELIYESRQDKWIQLVCYCDNYEECHRSILYRYLEAKYPNDVVLLD